MNRPLVIAITGASGAVYAVRLVQVLARACPELHLVISPAGRDVLQLELAMELGQDPLDPARLLEMELPFCESPAGD
ncbi:MAG: flavoprotein, partial [Planctomycetota bacterium]|nr:flavoprotein [Planctomycetota bacterium]